MASYDSGEITDRERLAAERQKNLANYNAWSTYTQNQAQLKNYDQANRQNRALANVQLKQNSRKNESDRFEAQRDLQNSALGLLGSMNQAMNGSTIGNFMRMFENRNDKDNDVYWAQHQVNQNQIENSYQDSLNQNIIAANDTAINGEKALRDITGDLAANLANINPNLYEDPNPQQAAFTDPDGNNYGWHGYAANNMKPDNLAKISGYMMPDNSVQSARKENPRNTLTGNDYYSKLINRFNGRIR